MMIAINRNDSSQSPFPLPRPDVIHGRGGLETDRFFSDSSSRRDGALRAPHAADDSLFGKFQPIWWPAEAVIG